MTEYNISGVRVQFIFDTQGKVVGIIFPDIKPDGIFPLTISYNYGVTEALATSVAEAVIAGLG